MFSTKHSTEPRHGFEKGLRLNFRELDLNWFEVLIKFDLWVFYIVSATIAYFAFHSNMLWEIKKK